MSELATGAWLGRRGVLPRGAHRANGAPRHPVALGGAALARVARLARRATRVWEARVNRARKWECDDRHWMPEGWCSYCLASGVYNGNCREHCWPMADALRRRNADAQSAWENEGGR